MSDDAPSRANAPTPGPDPQALHSLVNRALAAPPGADALDRAAAALAGLTGSDIALVAVMCEDRMVFVGSHGLSEPWRTLREAPLSYSFCRHTARLGGLFVLEDASTHELVRDGVWPSELGVAAYAGTALRQGETVVGSLCLISHRPRAWSTADLGALQAFAELAEGEVAARLERCSPPTSTPQQEVTEQVAAEERLRQSEQRYRALFEQSSDGIFVTTPDGRIVSANPALARMLGVPLHELPGRAVRDFYPQPGDRDVWRAAAHRTGALHDYPLVLRSAQQRRVDCLLNVTVVRKDDVVVAYQGALTDVTRMQRSQRLLAGQRAVLERIARREPLKAILRELISFVESALPGCTASVLQRNDETDSLHYIDAGRLPEAYVRASAQVPIGAQCGSCGTAVFRREAVYVADIATDPLWVGPAAAALESGLAACWSTPVFGHGDNVLGSFAVYFDEPRHPTADEEQILDIAGRLASNAVERQQADAALQFQAMVLNRIGESVIATDLAGRVTYWNTRAEEMFGWTREEAFGRSIVELTPALHSVEEAQAIMAELRAGRPWSGEFTVRHRSGREFPAIVSNAPVFDPAGNLIGIVGVSHDLTERKKLEAQHRQAQKMEAVGRLAGGIAHDFNNILTIVCGGLAELRETVSDPLVHAEVEEIAAAADRAAALTRQLLAFTRQQNVHPVVLNMNAAVCELQGMLRRLIGEHIAFDFDLADGCWNVRADRTQVEQVVLNLALNARDAMERGGTLRISTRNVFVREGELQALGATPGEYVVLSVVDTGHGMDADTLAHIFEPFFTTKPHGDGTGLGLATVFGIARQCGGFACAESQPGAGSTFRVYLPRATAEATADAPEAPRQEGSAAATRVLVVEDDEAVRRYLCRVLRRHGLHVEEAASPAEARHRCEELSGSIDVLLSDMVMPGGSGAELAVHVRTTCPDIGIVLMSGYTEEAFRAEHSLAETLFLEKPFSTDALLAALAHAAALRSGS